MKRVPVVLTILFGVVGLAGAQKPEMAKPGPEHQRLQAFVGTWTFDGEMKAGPMGPGGKMSGTDRVQWLPGNFALERRFEGTGPMGKLSGLEILAYDSAKKAYTFNFFDSLGSVGSGTLIIDGNTWTASGTSSMAGTSMQDRCKLTFGAGSNMLAISCEMSTDGKTWIPVFEGKATKTK